MVFCNGKSTDQIQERRVSGLSENTAAVNMPDHTIGQEIEMPGFFPSNISLNQYIAAFTVFSCSPAPCYKLLFIITYAQTLIAGAVYGFDYHRIFYSSQFFRPGRIGNNVFIYDRNTKFSAFLFKGAFIPRILPCSLFDIAGKPKPFRQVFDSVKIKSTDSCKYGISFIKRVDKLHQEGRNLLTITIIRKLPPNEMISLSGSLLVIFKLSYHEFGILQTAGANTFQRPIVIPQNSSS